MVVNHKIIHHTALFVFARYADGKIFDVVVEDRRLDVQFRALVADRPYQGRHFEVGVWDDVVGNEKRANTCNQRKNRKRQHRPLQRDASRLDCREFKFFAEVAVGHNGRQ